MAKKILIVDDEEDMQTFLSTLFTNNGYDIQTAADGKEAEQIVGTFNPDVITLDIIMPNETGVKFYRYLCKDPELSKIPVIIVSGVSQFKELFARDHATMPKPFAFVEKPYDENDLLEKVQEAAA